MPIMGTFDVTIPHITKLDNDQPLQNFLLHGVYCTHNITFGQKRNVNELYYRVTLIGSNGLSDPKCTDQVFDGHLMNKWIARVGTGIKVKNKFIYEGAITTTPSVMNQGIINQGMGNHFPLSQTMPNLTMGNALGLSQPMQPLGLSQTMMHPLHLSKTMWYGRSTVPLSQGNFVGATPINNEDWFGADEHNMGGV